MSSRVNKRPEKSAGARKSEGRRQVGGDPERAIVALLSERTIGAAAERAGVSERTIRCWMTEDGFREQLADARRAAFQAGMSRVQALTAEAVETLAALMAPDVSPAVRLGAARTVAELGLYQHDAELITSKLAALEATLRRQEERR